MTDQEYLQVVLATLRYDPESGHFYRMYPVKGNPTGSIAGNVTGQGYRNVMAGGVRHKAHRMAWLIMTGSFPKKGEDLDHINGDRLDNRWVNLRLVTRSQNQMNRGLQISNKSGHRGVSFRKDTGKWHARVYKDGKAILLGNFDAIEDAIAARNAGEAKHFGEHSGIGREKPSVRRHGRPDWLQSKGQTT